jgi:hypothetical protein
MMPFNTLLLRCLMQEMNFTENGVTVSVRRASDEVVLFFHIDGDSNTPFRKDLKHSGRLCDLLVFRSGSSKKVLCLVELKKGDMGTAVAQILETKKILIEQFKKDPMKRDIQNDAPFKCFVRKHGGSPIGKKEKIDLEKEFGKGQWKVSEKDDLGEFLRSP